MVELDPHTIWNIFYYFFGNFLHGDTDEKVDLGNKERPNVDDMLQVNIHVDDNHTDRPFNKKNDDASAKKMTNAVQPIF